ncbi:MAG: YtxH domain-containing protein [Eggerthellaceae bacterium]|jgi:gas vesicle protein
MGRFGAFVLGGIVGAAAALLTAPRPGDETRAIVTDWCNNTFGDANNIAAGIQDRARQAVDNATTAGQQAYTAAASRVQQVGKDIPGMSAEDGDELRAKIEEARQRIASQVVQNADGARQAINDTIPAVTEAMKANAARVQSEAAKVAAQAESDAADIEDAVVTEVKGAAEKE